MKVEIHRPRSGSGDRKTEIFEWLVTHVGPFRNQRVLGATVGDGWRFRTLWTDGGAVWSVEIVDEKLMLEFVLRWA